MAAKRPARASLRYAKAPLSPRYRRKLHQLLGHCSEIRSPTESAAERRFPTSDPMPGKNPNARPRASRDLSGASMARADAMRARTTFVHRAKEAETPDGQTTSNRRKLSNWPKGPEAAYLGFCRNKCGTDHGSDRRRYMATLSAGNLKPRPSDTRSALTGYFGLLGLMATMRNSSSFDRKVRP